MPAISPQAKARRYARIRGKRALAIANGTLRQDRIWLKDDIAWVAGLFEGEGCFSILKQRNGVHYPKAVISMTDADIIARFHTIVGFGRVTIKHRRPNTPEHYKLLSEWRAHSFEDAQQLIAMLWPWLGERRKARAKEILAAYHATRKAGNPYYRMRHKRRGDSQ